MGGALLNCPCDGAPEASQELRRPGECDDPEDNTSVVVSFDEERFLAALWVTPEGAVGEPVARRFVDHGNDPAHGDGRQRPEWSGDGDGHSLDGRLARLDDKASSAV